MALIVRCANCSKDHEISEKKAKQKSISCPHCNVSGSTDDFSAVMFCPHCYAELLVPLDVLKAELQCPYCDKTFRANITVSLDDDDNDDEDEILELKEAQPQSAFAPGDVFDKYKMVKLLGKGGMGEVYLVQHMLLNTQLALKIMNGETFVNNPIYAKRFIREAKLANKIQSENFIAVQDVGMESKSGSLFIAMEYVKGKNLSEIMHEKGPFTEMETLEICSKVAAVLIILEREKIVHRDIKPSNIMISEDGTVKLADLGIAKSESSEENELTLTQGNLVFGTPNYASPEQCRSSHNVDYRTDIYSLGATMFHMVAGCPPYEGSTTMDTILQVLNGEPKDLQKLAPNMSSGFILLVNDMLKHDPDQRPPNAEALKMRIDSLLAGRKSFAAYMKIKWKIVKSQSTYIASKLWDLAKKLYRSIPREAFVRLFKVAFTIIFGFICFFGGLKYRYKLFEGWNYIKKEFISGVNQKTPAAQADTPKKTEESDGDNENEPPAETYIADNTTPVHKTPSRPAVKPVRKPSAPIVRDNVSVAIAMRLDKCNNELMRMENDAANVTDRVWYMDRLKFYRQLQTNLKKQLQNSRDAFALRRKNKFSTQNSTTIFDMILEYSKRDENKPFERNDRVFAKQLLHYLKDDQSNPNMTISDSTHPEFSGPLLRWIEHAKLPYKDEIEKTLMIHHVSTECITGDCSIELCKYGVKDMKGMLFKKIHNKEYDEAIILINYGADPNETDEQGRTPLHYAVQHDKSALVRQLLLAGADPNSVPSGDFQTPLFFAEKYASPNIVRMMYTAGANDNCTDLNNLKPSDYSYVKEFNRLFRNADIAKISSMLAKHPDLATLEMRGGITPIQQAVKNNNLSLVNKLLSLKADPNQTASSCKYTPIQLAYKNFRSPKLNLRSRRTAANIMTQLLKKGASGKVKPLNGSAPTLLQDALNDFRVFSDMHVNFVRELIKSYDIKEEFFPILSKLYEHKHLYYGADNFSDKRSQALNLLLASEPDLDSDDFEPLFPTIAWSPNITESDLNKLIARKIRINGMDDNGHNAISALAQYSFKNSIHIDAEAKAAIVRRIKYLRAKGVTVESALKNLDLPHNIAEALK